jgi:hypothetical protein
MAEAGLERILLVGVLLPLLAGLVYVVIKWPDLANKGIILGIFSALVASIAWSMKEVVASYHRRTQVLIMEILSDGRPRTRQEIASRLVREGIIFRLLSLHEDALANLVLEKIIDINNGAYRLTTSGVTKSA